MCASARIAAAVGRCFSGAYALRRNDPAFAAQWQAALECGYARLEAMLIERAAPAGGGGCGGSDPIAGEDGPAPPDPADMDPQLALLLLRLHRSPLKGREKPGGCSPQRASKAELIAALLKQLRILRLRMAADGQR